MQWHIGNHGSHYLNPDHPTHIGIVKACSPAGRPGFEAAIYPWTQGQQDLAPAVVIADFADINDARRQVETWWREHVRSSKPAPQPHRIGYSRHYVLVGLLGDQVSHVLGPWYYLAQAQEELLNTAEQHPAFDWHIHPLKHSLDRS